MIQWTLCKWNTNYLLSIHCGIDHLNMSIGGIIGQLVLVQIMPWIMDAEIMIDSLRNIAHYNKWEIAEKPRKPRFFGNIYCNFCSVIRGPTIFQKWRILKDGLFGSVEASFMPINQRTGANLRIIIEQYFRRMNIWMELWDFSKWRTW